MLRHCLLLTIIFLSFHIMKLNYIVCMFIASFIVIRTLLNYTSFLPYVKKICIQDLFYKKM